MKSKLLQMSEQIVTNPKNTNSLITYLQTHQNCAQLRTPGKWYFNQNLNSVVDQNIPGFTKEYCCLYYLVIISHT